ncbi:uncharacterized protein BDV14DRAFT_195412 [Aspergillus stella-maris]|uniref:uncharacterized protein n=1 Tax=Aspergillus stella-maris TaxID=1810926 RepID=UPI003CCD3C0A
MNGTVAKWAYVSLAAFATLSEQFNRSALDAPWVTEEASDTSLSTTLDYLNTTEFVAYDKKFFDVLGPDATIEQVHELAFKSHEAPCYLKEINQLFFVEWSPPGGGENGTHSWQYLLDVDTTNLRISRRTPRNITRMVVSTSTTRLRYLENKPGHITEGNENRVAAFLDGRTLYIPGTGVSKYYPTEKTPYGKRDLSAFDFSSSGSVLSNRRLLSNPISYFYDGVQVSRNGWIFCGVGDAVDVIDH